MTKPKLLDLYCGDGGAGFGYYLAGFEVIGVDIAPRQYPFEFHQADALAYLAEHWREFDAIHASPPCQAWSKETAMQYRGNHQKLIGLTREALAATGKPFVIENVPGARYELRNPVMFCGSMFGLQVWRHRYFEFYPEFFTLMPPCNHSFVPVLVTGTTRRKGCQRVDPPVALRRSAMGIDWPMRVIGLDEAIPPAYTEFIGRQLWQALEHQP
jgi:DNA (cytosine-5)-methyltransferase 1